MRKKILIIDDAHDLCKILSVRFKDRGFDVLIANDGLAGLEKAKAEKPDIIILDLVLPGLNGEEVCKEIRRDPAIGDTPIIMLTAKSSEIDRVVGKVIGANSYIVKPFGASELLDEVNKLIESKNRNSTGVGLLELKNRLLALLNKDALKKGTFTLSSGKTSNFYLDGRLITLSPEGAFLVASIILHLIKGRAIDTIGGPTLGADPIVGAVACLSHIINFPIKTFIVRKSAKEHGTARLIEGPELKQGNRVILVDDVATTGKALIEAKQALDKIGVIVEVAIVIVDRNEGAKENLSKAGLELESIFNIEDFGL